MIEDVRQLINAGVDGIVIGCLDVSGDVDEAACQVIIEAARLEDASKARNEATPGVTNSLDL